MIRRRALALATLAVLSGGVLPGAATAQGRGGEPHGSFAPGRAIVGTTAQGRSAASRAILAHGGRIESFQPAGDFFVVRTPTAVPGWVASVRGASGVRYAEPDFVVAADDLTPNDPLWTSQWGPPKVGAPQAWTTTTGSTGVVVGVLDTGVDYTHEDLASQIWTNPGEVPGDGIDDDGDGLVDDVHGADCANDDGDPMDDNGHGTEVAGVIGAAGNNGVGIAGFEWQAQIMPLKFLREDGTGLISDAVECLDYAIAHGVAITNSSWGGFPYSQALVDAIGRARASGQLFVASAGNNSTNTDTGNPHYPADYDLDNVVSVAASDPADALASFSNFGTMSVDLAAPGVGILTTAPGNAYTSLDGTSFAAPAVAGAAALLLAAHPGIDFAQLVDRLNGSVDKVPSLTGKVGTGGRLNTARAIETDTTAPGAIRLSAPSSARTSVGLSWVAPADDGAAGSPVSSYVLWFAPAGSGAWAEAKVPAPAAPGTRQKVTVRGLRPGTSYDFALTAKDNVGNTSVGRVTANTAPGAEVFFDDMESGSTPWTASGSWTPTSEEPHSPSTSWSDSPGGPYANNQDASLVSPAFSLAGASNPSLSFWHRYQINGRDGGSVSISTNGGATWTQLVRYTGASDFDSATINLAPYAGATSVMLRFRLVSDGSIANDGWYVDDVLVTADDTSAPAAPQGLVATPSDGQVALDWADNAEPDLASYRVYRTTDPPEAATRSWSLVASPTTSSYTDTGLTDGTPYFFRVTAVDTSGNEGQPSPEVASTPANVDAPAAPTGLIATAMNAQVALDWSDNTEPDIDVYRVYRTTDPPTAETRLWVPIATTASSDLLDTAVLNGTTYFYVVTAVDAVGNESAPSAEASATPDASIRTYAPSRVSISTGTSLGDPIGNLVSSDDQYVRVASTGTAVKQTVDWTATAAVDATGATRLTVAYEGSWSAAVTQKLWIRNVAAGVWEQVFSVPVSTADRTFTWSTTDVAPYVSARGEVRFRVSATGQTAVTCRADLLRLTLG